MSKNQTLAGVGFGLGAYGIWGFFPLFFRQLGAVQPLDVLCNRAVWGCVFVSLILSAKGHWGPTLAVFERPRLVARLGLAALLVGSNWLAFLWAVDQHQVMASSLGYFLTPLVNVLLGMLVLRERLSRLEWASVGLALLALVRPRPGSWTYVVVVVVLLGAIAAQLLLSDPGYVLVRFRGYDYETTVAAAERNSSTVMSPRGAIHVSRRASGWRRSASTA